jgi:metal-responsive CopG/Arc/MetJ family transcriptional regulator
MIISIIHTQEVIQMRATLNIPDELIEEVQDITGTKSKTKAIITAMEGFIRQQKVKELIQCKGTIDIDYDWEKEEEAEIQTQRQREDLIERKTDG